MSVWRIGGKVPLNVYENDKPMFQCHAPEDASRIVDALNRTMNPVLHINTEAEQIAQLQRELAEVRKWVNCGGAPSGRLCCFDPLDMHEIYGGGQTLQDGSFICDVHAVQRAYEQLAAERERITQLDALIGTITLCAECNGTRIPKPPKQPYCCPIGHARECECKICQWRRYGYQKAERNTQLEAENESLKAALREAEKASAS